MSNNLPSRASNRLHFLLYNEPHPDLIGSFEDYQIHWDPIPAPPKFKRIFQQYTRGLTPIQRLVVNLALRMAISGEEAWYLHHLHAHGWYRCDKNPQVFLFNIGRGGGKTEMAARLACLWHLRHGAQVFCVNKQRADFFRDRFGIMPHRPPELPDVMNLLGSRLQYETRSYILDDMMEMEGWEEALDRSERFMGIGDFPGHTIIDYNGANLMALTVPLHELYPDGVHRSVEDPLQVSSWVRHTFGGG